MGSMAGTVASRSAGLSHGASELASEAVPHNVIYDYVYITWCAHEPALTWVARRTFQMLVAELTYDVNELTMQNGW